jgi:hypothetical protein
MNKSMGTIKRRQQQILQSEHGYSVAQYILAAASSANRENATLQPVTKIQKTRTTSVEAEIT